MVDEGNVHDTAVILLERFKHLKQAEGLELSVLRRLNDMNRLRTGINVERCEEAAVKDLEWLKLEVGNELGTGTDNEQLSAVLKEMFEIQKAKIPAWS